jgi:hypothetical protein
MEKPAPTFRSSNGSNIHRFNRSFIRLNPEKFSTEIVTCLRIGLILKSSF